MNITVMTIREILTTGSAERLCELSTLSTDQESPTSIPKKR